MSTEKIEIAREKILNETLFAFAILGIPTLGSSLFRAMQIGWTFLFTWHVVLVVLLWSTYFLRKYIAVNIKIISLVLLSIFTGLYGAWELGLQGGWQTIVIVAPILITIFFGRYKGIIVLIIITCILALIAYWHLTNTPEQIILQASPISNSSLFWTNTILTILFIVSPLLISIGKVQQMLNNNIQDLTVSKRDLLKIQNELLSTFEFIPIPIMIFNFDNEIVRVNRRFSKLLGYNQTDLKTISDWFELAFPKIAVRTVAVDLWNANSTKSMDENVIVKPSTFKIISKDGNEFHLEVIFKAYENRIMAVFNDLSFQVHNMEELRESEAKLKIQNDDFLKLNQELMLSNDQITEMNQKLLSAKKKAEESDSHKTVFLQNISHEIRTPLNAIIGFTEMLTDRDLPEGDRESFLDIVLNSGNQLLDVVNDIISVSSIEAGRAVLIEEPLNINELLNSLVQYYEVKAKDSSIKFSSHFPLNDENAMILVDSKKIKQIFTNLLNNAFKFTAKGKISIGYNLRSDFIVFYVKDTGVGVKSEYHQSIFERFSKGDIDLSHKYSGTGLGLSISKAFIELMGGRIWLLSEENKGATFFFTIPFKPVEKS